MYYLSIFIFALGLFILSAEISGLSLSKADRLSYKLIARSFPGEAKRTKARKAELVRVISRYVRLSDYRRISLKTDLLSAEIKLSPEEYIAEAVLSASPLFIGGIVSLLVSVPLGLVLLFSGFIIYRSYINGIQKKLKQKRAEIENELAALTAFIEKSLKHTRDLPAILKEYIPSGKAMEREMKILLADMETGNYEQAILRFEGRCGSTEVSDLCRGLISVLRGDNTEVYWAVLKMKFSEMSREILKNRSLKIPSKVNRLSMLLLGCFMMIFLSVILIEIAGSLGSMFG